MKHTIFVEENIPLLAEALNPCGEVTKYSGRKLSNKDLINSGCSDLFIRSTTKIVPELIEGSSVKFIGTATSGIDHVNVEYLKNKQINFAYAPGSNANSVAEYVVYSILKWRDITKSQLGNKTIGIVGFGNIGKIVAKYSYNLGLKILVNDPLLKDENFNFPDFVNYVELDELCHKSDIITNHVPLTDEVLYPTLRLFNSHNIQSIKSNALFIHTSRGSVVDENALIAKLKEDKFHLSIDVWENEPNINSELLKNTIIATPHVAGYSRDGKIRGAKMIAEAFQKFSGIEPNYHAINQELSIYKPLNSDYFQDYEKLYLLLSKSRDLDEDTKNLKDVIMRNTGKGDIFDALRKNYPQRREIL